MNAKNSNKEIYIKMFGFFDIFFEGTSIFFDNSSSLRAVTILKFLLLNKDTEQIPEVIMESIFPDKIFSDPKKVLRTYIHRLRKILYSNNTKNIDFSKYITIINVGGNYKIEISENVILDIDIFENCVEILEVETDDLVLSKFIETYSGELLQEEGSWPEKERIHYRRHFYRIINKYLKFLYEINDFEKLIDVCENCFKVYNTDEIMNLYFLKSLKSLNRINDVAEHYRFITKKMLLENLNFDNLKKFYENINNDDEKTENFSTDEERIKIIVKDAIKNTVKNYAMTESPKYMIAYIEIKSDTKDIKYKIATALEYVLRKNDMFAVTENNTIIILLKGLSEDFIATVTKRINETLISYLGEGSELKLNILPVKII